MHSGYQLVVIIVSDDDADRLITKLVERSFPATKVSSTGGFLRRGSATILSGIEAVEVEEVIAIIRRECAARTEVIPVPPLPPDSTLLPAPLPVEVRVGGAIVFVLPVERFEKT